MEETPFFPTPTREMNRTTNQQKKDDEDEDSVECPNSQCMEEFHSLIELEACLNVTGHHSPAEQVRSGLYNTLEIDQVRHISLDGKRQTGNERFPPENTRVICADSVTFQTLKKL